MPGSGGCIFYQNLFSASRGPQDIDFIGLYYWARARLRGSKVGVIVAERESPAVSRVMQIA
jgi:hypothetical protein